MAISAFSGLVSSACAYVRLPGQLAAPRSPASVAIGRFRLSVNRALALAYSLERNAGCGILHTFGNELCRDCVVDLFLATLTLHSNHGNSGSTHFVSRKTGLAIKTVLARH